MEELVMQATRFDPQEQLSIPQVAALLQCSERWLYGKVREGQLKATHLGRTVRISRFSLQEFLDTRHAWVPPGTTR
ncbi:MAG: helix-turn-helix domain-containing protein [Actinomycetota bacterium]|nr:helix-turn-helix domain-containing protein [Actinomycetota bacterium]